MAVALSTSKITSPMLTICIDIIRGRQQITIYLYPFFVPILVYALFMQVSTDLWNTLDDITRSITTLRNFKKYMSNKYVVSNSKLDHFTILKDVRAHCYCASLVRTLYMTWHVPRHLFQARAPSRNSTKYRTDDLCGNLICYYFCWMLGDPHFFSADRFLF